LLRSLYAVSTHFETSGANSAQCLGFSPIHKFTQHGIFVLQNRLSPWLAAALPSAPGARPLVVGAPGKPANRLPGHSRRAGDAPDTAIATQIVKGKFYFGNRKKRCVSYTGSIKLPSGLDTSKPHASRSDRKYRGQCDRQCESVGTAVSNANVMKSLKISYKAKRRTVHRWRNAQSQHSIPSWAWSPLARYRRHHPKAKDVGPGKKQTAYSGWYIMDGVPYEGQCLLPTQFQKTVQSGTIGKPFRRTVVESSMIFVV